MTDSTEQWRPVVGFEDSYEVSDHGRVRSLDRIVWYTRSDSDGLWQKNIKGRVISGRIDDRGYLRVHLGRRGNGYKKGIHVMVCEAFHGPRPSETHHACHTDGNALNNHAANVRWGTALENVHDALRHGTHPSVAQKARTHCPRGHEFTPENTRIRANGGRCCRRCDGDATKQWCRDNRELYNARMREYRAKNREAINAAARKKYRSQKSKPTV